MTRNQLKQLEFLVFKRGGVSGAIRRIIYRWRGIFTASMILGKLYRKYPLLLPNQHQLTDCIETLERSNRIHRILANECAIFYKLSAYQLKFSF